MSTTATVTQTTLQAAPGPFSGDVKAKINFSVLPADGSTPYNYVEEPPEGVPRSNVGTAEHEVVIHDIRGHESEFEIDVNGFAVFKTHDSPDVDFASEDSIKSKYYPEVEQLLKDKIPGTHKVVIFDHTLRRADPSSKRGPVLRAHVDQTEASAGWRVPLHVTDKEESDRLLKGRYRIVNVWRPINGAVESTPLAVGDNATFPDEFVVPTEHRYPDRTGLTAAVLHNPHGQWHYLSSMRNDERLFLQCWDSKSRSRTPHTAFVDPRSTAESKPRESIEVRALVFGN